jgi:phospholipase C
VVSPWARSNFVDHSLSNQTSVVRFIEDNWDLGRVGGGSFDSRSSSLTGLFDFGHPNADKLLLDPSTGQRAGD